LHHPDIGSVAYQYDNDSRLTSASVTGQSSVCYSYDTASRLTGIGQGTCPVGTNSTKLTYDNANRPNTLTLPNGIVLTYGYDDDSRVVGMTYKLGTTTAIGGLTYQYDAVSRRTQMGGSLAATGFPQALSLATYDVANELTNWNGTTITSDANGNVLNDGSAAYTWNGRNQLISRGGTSFQYDAYGRRILNAAGNSLLYEGWNAGQELSGTTPTANRILGGIDEFFSRADSTGAYSPITDALGSVLALTNSAGNITTQYGYDPYGNTTSYGGPSANVFQYTGRENDGNGLYFYRARYYSPQFGRFISEDPLRWVVGNASFYPYVRNNPATLNDPSGLYPNKTPEPPGGPPMPVPGAPDLPWSWNPNPGDSRNGTYRPDGWEGSGQPSVNWDPNDGGHWDLVPGNGGSKERFDRWGNPIPPDDAHRRPTPGCKSPKKFQMPGVAPPPGSTTAVGIGLTILLWILAVGGSPLGI
jgi:RHS repeat-associated protein